MAVGIRTRVETVAGGSIAQVVARVATLPIGLISTAIISRYLGVSDYGNYTFVLAFWAVLNLISEMYVTPGRDHRDGEARRGPGRGVSRGTARAGGLHGGVAADRPRRDSRRLLGPRTRRDRRSRRGRDRAVLKPAGDRDALPAAGEDVDSCSRRRRPVAGDAGALRGRRLGGTRVAGVRDRERARRAARARVPDRGGRPTTAGRSPRASGQRRHPAGARCHRGAGRGRALLGGVLQVGLGARLFAGGFHAGWTLRCRVPTLRTRAVRACCGEPRRAVAGCAPHPRTRGRPARVRGRGGGDVARARARRGDGPGAAGRADRGAGVRRAVRGRHGAAVAARARGRRPLPAHLVRVVAHRRREAPTVHRDHRCLCRRRGRHSTSWRSRASVRGARRW